jgi:hypothetical protein
MGALEGEFGGGGGPSGVSTPKSIRVVQKTNPPVPTLIKNESHLSTKYRKTHLPADQKSPVREEGPKEYQNEEEEPGTLNRTRNSCCLNTDGPNYEFIGTMLLL